MRFSKQQVKEACDKAILRDRERDRRRASGFALLMGFLGFFLGFALAVLGEYDRVTVKKAEEIRNGRK